MNAVATESRQHQRWFETSKISGLLSHSGQIITNQWKIPPDGAIQIERIKDSSFGALT